MKKICSKCGIEKNLSEFHRDCKSPDKCRGTCKLCHRAVVRAWKKKNKEKVQGYDKKYKELHKEEAIEYGKKWNKRNPEKYKAHGAVSNAVRDGRLTKQPCNCGCLEVQGHHEDYSKLLDVVWMCIPCHRKYHRRREYCR